MDKTPASLFYETFLVPVFTGNSDIQHLRDELKRAETLHPVWPDDVIHAAAILAEETGEVMKAALDLTYANGTVEDLRTELIQVGAMALRCLKNLPKESNHEQKS